LIIARTLQPNLVVLCTAAGAERERSFCDSVHAERPGGDAIVVSVYNTEHEGDWICPSDYCLERDAAFGEEMTAIVNSLLVARGQRST
jgi:hypothetical protein